MTNGEKPAHRQVIQRRYPAFVYRAFKERSHAEDFAHAGRFRMGNLRIYRAHEDSERRDSSEGEGHFQRRGSVTTVDFVLGSDDVAVAQAPGYVHTYTELLSPKFILCCLLPQVDLEYARSRFGGSLVRINDPRRLSSDISSYLTSLSDHFVGVDGCFVRYDKGRRTETTKDPITSIRRSYCQKPSTFRSEREFRFVVINTEPPGSRYDADYLTIDLGHALSYVTVI